MAFRLKVLAVCVLTACAAFCSAVFGQTTDQLRERFRAECRAQFPHLRGPEHSEQRAARVSQCVKSKFVARNRDSKRREAAEPVSPRSEMKLVESRPWLVADIRGPADAKGVIFFARGYPDPTSLESYQPVPYVLKTLSDKGWDIISARVPRGLNALGVEKVAEGAAVMRRRVKELKEQGYRRVVLAGHSWGAWAALRAAEVSDFGADVLLLSAPNTFGSRMSRWGNGPNRVFQLSVTEFPGVLAPIKTPTVLILPDDKDWDPDPGRRGDIALKHFTRNNLANLTITKPPGFFGHFAAWLPVFDYAYGKCIEDFLERPVSGTCTPTALSNNDFHSIVELAQVAEFEKMSIASAEPLVGKSFVAYTLTPRVTRHYEYTSPEQRKHMESGGVKTESVVFRDALHCAANECSKLVRWSERQVLEFDTKSGKLIGWWVQQP